MRSKKKEIHLNTRALGRKAPLGKPGAGGFAVKRITGLLQALRDRK